MKKQLIRFAYLLVTLPMLLAVLSNSALAVSCPSGMSSPDCAAIQGTWENWVPDDGNSNFCSTPSTSMATTGNIDYAGRPIFNQAQLAEISKNQPVYEEAADQVGIPWQMIAVIHARESGLSHSNPSNGQGIYQFVSQQGGPYPTGPVSDEEFLRQTVLAAKFIKSKASSNYPANQDLTTSSSPNTIKDTFFSYNGRASAYIDQAASLGYDKSSQGFEGSPYVMNKADAKRDPASNPSGWGQIKTDHGGLSYPANNDYGAFVQFAALTGIPTTGAGSCGGNSTVNCQSPNNSTAGLSPIRQSVVCLAQQELALWQSGQMEPGTGPNGYYKYSQNRTENWCGDFVSWLYIQAGDPLIDSNGGYVPAVQNIMDYAKDGTAKNFTWHPAGSYTPLPGDLIIHKTGASHVNMVVGVSGNTMTYIGGNQKTWYFNTSSVSQGTYNGFSGGDITGYVSPN